MLRIHLIHRALILPGALLAAMALAACSRQTAEEAGREMAAGRVGVAQGMGAALGQQGKAAAESVAGGLGKVVKGAGRGMDRSGRVLVATPAIAQAHMQITKVQNATPTIERAVHGLEAYVLTEAEVRGQLRVQVFDLRDREIGRARVDLQQAAEEGRYVTIPLDDRIDLASVAKVAFDYAPTLALATLPATPPAQAEAAR